MKSKHTLQNNFKKRRLIPSGPGWENGHRILWPFSDRSVTVQWPRIITAKNGQKRSKNGRSILWPFSQPDPLEITRRWLTASKINKFIMLWLSQAMKNGVMRIKIVYFGIRTFQNFYVALWDSWYLKEIHFLEASTLINCDDKRIYRAKQKLLAHIVLPDNNRAGHVTRTPCGAPVRARIRQSRAH